MQSTLALHAVRRIHARQPALTDAALIVTGSLVIAALAQVRIPLPFTPVPITLQTFAVLLIGALLGSRRGAATVALYIAEGALGLPFFSGGSSGLAALAGPTGGYLAGFVVAAFVVGWMAERGLDRSLKTSLVPFLVGDALILALGTFWLSLSVGFTNALVMGFLPFIAGDLLKILAAGALLPAAWKWIQKL